MFLGLLCCCKTQFPPSLWCLTDWLTRLWYTEQSGVWFVAKAEYKLTLSSYCCFWQMIPGCVWFFANLLVHFMGNVTALSWQPCCCDSAVWLFCALQQVCECWRIHIRWTSWPGSYISGFGRGLVSRSLSPAGICWDDTPLGWQPWSSAPDRGCFCLVLLNKHPSEGYRDSRCDLPCFFAALEPGS